MKLIYKQLMKQYGGSIPFSAIQSKRKRTIQRKRSNRKKKLKKNTKRKSKLRKTKKQINSLSTKLAIGTIIRKNNKLYILTNNKQWIHIK